MKIFLLVLVTIVIFASAVFIGVTNKNEEKYGVFNTLLTSIMAGLFIVLMWEHFYFGTTVKIKNGPTPLDSVQEIILVDTDGNEFYFDILEVE